VGFLWGLAQQAEREAVNFYVPGSNPGFPAVISRRVFPNSIYRKGKTKKYE
jgi:hypothetical protein